MKCRENDIAYPPPRSETERGRGTMRSMVEGACGAEAGREAEAPPTALRAVPPPRSAGRDDGACCKISPRDESVQNDRAKQ